MYGYLVVKFLTFYGEYMATTPQILNPCYSRNQPFTTSFPSPISSPRPPTNLDKGVPGQIWLYQTGNTLTDAMYILVETIGGLPNWQALSGTTAPIPASLTPTNLTVSNSVIFSAMSNGVLSVNGAGVVSASSAISGNSITTTTTGVIGSSLTVGTTATIGTGLTVSAGGAAITGNSSVVGNLAVTGTMTYTGGTSVVGAFTQTGGNVSIGADNAAYSYLFATGTAAKAVTIGSTDTTSSTAIYAGTGHIIIDGAATTNTTIGASTTSGVMTIGGSVQVGNFVLCPSTGALTATFANNNGAKVISIGNGINGNTVTVANGINTSAQTVSIANGAAGASSTVSILSGAATAGTQTLNLGSGAFAATINIGNAAAVVKTITLGGSGANVIKIGDTSTLGSIAIGTAGTTSTSIGNATGTLALAGTTIGLTGTTTNTGDLGITTGNLNINTAGKSITVKAGGANAKSGQTTLVAGASPLISTTGFTANSVVLFERVNINAGTPGPLYLSTVTAGASFIISSTNGADISTVNWIIIDKA